MLMTKETKESKWWKDVTPCSKCYCMTHSIRKARANFICGKCGADKTLSDVLFYEAMKKGGQDD